MRTRPSLIVASVLSVLLVVLGFWLVISGWPMRTPAQITRLDLAHLPLAGAILVWIIELTWPRRLWLRSPRAFSSVFGPAAFALVLGCVLVAIAYLTPLRGISRSGQLLIWIGLGMAFIYLAVDSMRREVTDHRTLLLENIDKDAPEATDHLTEWNDEEELHSPQLQSKIETH